MGASLPGHFSFLCALCPALCALSFFPQDLNMKTKKPNAELVWKQFEDHLVPQLRLSTTDRAVYSYLVRHSRLEGKLRLRFSMAWLARGARVCDGAARPAVRRLLDHGALRLVERT